MDTNQILDLIRKNGPALPIEISSAFNADSFLAKAYLTELVNTGQLKTTKKVGESHIYFLDGQEEEAQRKADSLVNQTQKRLRIFAKDKENLTPELAQKREQFEKHFKKSIDEPEKAKEPVVKKQPIQQAHTFIKNIIKRPKKVSKSKDEFIELAIRYLQQGLEITEELNKKKKEISLLANVPSSIGKVRFFIKVKSKQRINEADLSLAYTEGMRHNVPMLFVTNGKLSKSAEEYAESLGGMLKIKKLG